MEILDIDDDAPIPAVMSQLDKRVLKASRISKDGLPKDEYDKMHWTRLKKLLEAQGQTYENVTQCIEALRYIDAEPDL